MQAANMVAAKDISRCQHDSPPQRSHVVPAWFVLFELFRFGFRPASMSITQSLFLPGVLLLVRSGP